jgi:hypothetical protein
MYAQAFKAFLAGTFLAAGAVGAVAPELQKGLQAMLAAEHALRLDSAIQVAVPVITGLIAAFSVARRSHRSKAA